MLSRVSICPNLAGERQSCTPAVLLPTESLSCFRRPAVQDGRVPPKPSSFTGGYWKGPGVLAGASTQRAPAEKLQPNCSCRESRPKFYVQ